MKSRVAVALIVVGGLLIVIPVIANACFKSRNADHVAEFYTRNSSGISLPSEMQADSGPYQWASLLVGVGMVVTGVKYARSSVDANKEHTAPK